MLAPHLSGGVCGFELYLFDGVEQNIYHNCVDEIQGEGKSDILKKLGDINVYGMNESEEGNASTKGGGGVAWGWW